MSTFRRKLKWPKQTIIFLLPLLLLTLLISMPPNDYTPQKALASPGPIISVRNKGTVPDGAPKSREYVKQAGYTGRTRTQTSEGPKVCVKEFDIGIKEFEISAKGEACIKKVTTWTEREWKQVKVTWLEQPWRKIWVAVYFGGIECDWTLQDDTYQKEVPGSRTELTETRWERVANSETSKLVDPPGDGVNPPTKHVFIQDEEWELDFSFIDNIIPAAPPGTITHKLFLDGQSIADGTKLDLKTLGLGDHELLVELHTIDGQIIPIPIPFTVVRPIELLISESSKVNLDETKRFEFTVRNNLEADTQVNLRIEGIPPGWDVHLTATSLSVPASGDAKFEVAVRPTMGAFPQYSMSAVVTALSVGGGYHASANLDVDAVFPEDAEIYRVKLDNEEVLAFSIPKDTKLTNFQFEDGKIRFEAEQADTGFGLIIPRSLLEGPLQATGPGGDILPAIEDLFLSGTHGLFLSESPESGRVTISKKTSVETSPKELDELSGEIERLKGETTALRGQIEALRVEKTEAEGRITIYLVVGLVVGLIVGGGIAFIIMRRRKAPSS